MSRTYLDTVRRYFWWNEQELRSLVIIIFAFGLIISFENLELSIIGLREYFIGVLIAAITVFLHESGRRLVGIKYGFKIETNLWLYGLIIGILLMVISKGKLMFIAATGFTLHLMPWHRMGAFRYGINPESQIVVAISGPLFNILFATLIKTIDVWFGVGLTQIPFINSLFMINWIYAVCNLLPIPPLDGIKVLSYSRLQYIFIFGCIAGYASLIYFGGIYSYIFGLIIGIIVWAIYLLFIERGYFKL